MKTETSAFFADTQENIKKQNELIDNFLYEMEKADFTLQQVKNAFGRLEMRVKSASITNDTQTKFRKELGD